MQAEEESGHVAGIMGGGSGDPHRASSGVGDVVGVGAGHSAEQQLHPGVQFNRHLGFRVGGLGTSSGTTLGTT